MNTAQFKHLLQQLDDNDWQAVIDGQAIVMVDDMSLAVGSLQSANAIIMASEDGADSLGSIKTDSINGAEDILDNYYRTHPLTLKGFNHQVSALIERYGAAVFAAPIGQISKYTLFVKGGEVAAEAGDSPRHRYGAFCELGHSISQSAVNGHVIKWLERGDAYDQYLGMNVCRYNC